MIDPATIGDWMLASFMTGSLGGLAAIVARTLEVGDAERRGEPRVADPPLILASTPRHRSSELVQRVGERS